MKQRLSTPTPTRVAMIARLVFSGLRDPEPWLLPELLTTLPDGASDKVGRGPTGGRGVSGGNEGMLVSGGNGLVVELDEDPIVAMAGGREVAVVTEVTAVVGEPVTVTVDEADEAVYAESPVSDEEVEEKVEALEDVGGGFVVPPVVVEGGRVVPLVMVEGGGMVAEADEEYEEYEEE